MAGKPSSKPRRTKGRSRDQREWTAAVGRTAKLWEWLTDEERLTWNVKGETRRQSGFNLFMQTNVRRVRNDEPPARLPPQDAPPADNPVGELVITNRGSRVRIFLEVPRLPTVPISVWGSRPCKQGISSCDKCPRLGPLPAPKGGRSEITGLYFAKHGGYIDQHHVPLAGKRIFIRTRLELDGWTSLFKPTSAVVPGRGGQGRPETWW
jgi:hypothetical protein